MLAFILAATAVLPAEPIALLVHSHHGDSDVHAHAGIPEHFDPGAPHEHEPAPRSRCDGDLVLAPGHGDVYFYLEAGSPLRHSPAPAIDLESGHRYVLAPAGPQDPSPPPAAQQRGDAPPLLACCASRPPPSTLLRILATTPALRI